MPFYRFDKLILDRFDVQTGLLQPSLTMFETAPPSRTRITLELMESLRLVRLDRLEPPSINSSNGHLDDKAEDHAQQGQIIYAHVIPAISAAACIA